MINLYGWDTVSLTEVGLVNKALASGGNQLVTEFDFDDDDITLSGRFGSWQIAPGGGGQRMNVTIPIVSGAITGWLGEVNLGGIELTIKVILRLLAPPEAPDDRHLVFDFDATFSGDDSVEPVKVEDPDGRLNDLQKRGLVSAVAKCLSTNSEKVSFVFASVKARGTASAESLATPHHDWMVVNIVDGQQYLAILGAMKRPAKGASAVDTKLVSAKASAVLAISNTMLASRFLHPSIQSSFRPKAKFKVSGDTVKNARKIPLPRVQKGLVKIDPTITSLTLQPQTNLLRCKTTVKAPLKLLANFYTKLDMKMAVGFDKKTGRLSVSPDRHPKESHTVKFPAVLDFLIGWLVRWIVSFFDTAIYKAVVGIAGGFQSLNSPKIDTVKWNGIRDFKTGAVLLDGALVLSDVRAIE